VSSGQDSHAGARRASEPGATPGDDLCPKCGHVHSFLSGKCNTVLDRWFECGCQG
jgi:hypothetical protein